MLSRGVFSGSIKDLPPFGSGNCICRVSMRRGRAVTGAFGELGQDRSCAQRIGFDRGRGGGDTGGSPAVAAAGGRPRAVTKSPNAGSEPEGHQLLVI
jgi:hypothetical protein